VASWNEKFLYKLRGAQKWPWTDATIFSYIIGEPTRNNFRRIELSYSFWIEGHIYSGIAIWEENDPGIYNKDDKIQIQYNPSDPNQSYFPEKESLGTTFYLSLIAGVGFLALIFWNIWIKWSKPY
jgi:hypothetical protein